MILLNRNFSYWVGLFQSDGYMRGYKEFIGDNKKYKSITLGLEVKDKILAERFQKISNLIFDKNLKITYRLSHNTWRYETNVKNLLP